MYEEAAKEVALSVVKGFNCELFLLFFFIVFGTSTPCLVIINRKLFMYQLASVLAYGQTSSGKTYTMTGITEYAIADIYEYVHKVTIGSIVNCCLLRVLALLY